MYLCRQEDISMHVMGSRIKAHTETVVVFRPRAQVLCERISDSHPGLPVPNSPYHEPIYIYGSVVRTVFVDVKQH